MKTSIKTLLATGLTALVLSSAAFTTFANDTTKKKTVSAKEMNVNMVVVTGDVDVYLIQSNKEDIKVVPFGDGEVNIDFKKSGAKLLINNAGNNRATIYVYLKDLKRIDASNTAKIKTQGNFNLEALQIFLKDDAKANVKVNTKSLYTVIKDQSNLKLSGTAGDHQLVKAELATLKTQHFHAIKTNANTLKPTLAANRK